MCKQKMLAPCCSIIGVAGKPKSPLEKTSDTLVPYWSSHLDYVLRPMCTMSRANCRVNFPGLRRCALRRFGGRLLRLTLEIVLTLRFILFVWLVFFKFKWLKFSAPWAIFSVFILLHVLLIFLVGLRSAFAEWPTPLLARKCVLLLRCAELACNFQVFLQFP